MSVVRSLRASIQGDPKFMRNASGYPLEERVVERVPRDTEVSRGQGREPLHPGGASTMEPLQCFALPCDFLVPPNELTLLPLGARGGQTGDVDVKRGRLQFQRRGWFEVLLTVSWDSANLRGHRFAHTAIPDHHPLHSEAIEASVLQALSNGQQLLRGNSVFEPGEVDTISLEVWQDGGGPVTVTAASLEVRRLGD